MSQTVQLTEESGVFFNLISEVHRLEGKKEGEKIVLPPLSIPLSEVNLVSVYKTDVGKTILLAFGVIGVVIGGIFIIGLYVNFRKMASIFGIPWTRSRAA